MLSAVVLTKNEETNIERCLRSLRFCDEVIVVDDYSTDKTLSKLPVSLKIKVFQRELKGDFAEQRNFGLKKARGDWILFIDADEEVTNSLESEIKKALRHAQGDRRVMVSSTNHDAYYIRRRDFFWGKELKYGEVRSARSRGILRLVRKNSGTWMGDVHEVFHTAKNCSRLQKFLNHYPHPTLKEFISDINNYSTLRALELYNQGKSTNILEIMFVPALKFIYNFFLNFGIFDGPAGFTYAFMMSFHSYLVRAKLYQYKNIKTR